MQKLRRNYAEITHKLRTNYAQITHISKKLRTNLTNYTEITDITQILPIHYAETTQKYI